MQFDLDVPVQTELAWAAGFFDGEGCVTYRAQTGQLCLSIPQVDRRVLDRWIEAVGVGMVRGPYKMGAGRPGWQDQYVISITNFKGTKLTLERLWPWLGEVKREQGTLVLNAWIQETERGRKRKAVTGVRYKDKDKSL